MPSTSQTILGSTSHPNGGTTTTVFGDKFKADGYYGFTDGLHTVSFYFHMFRKRVSSFAIAQYLVPWQHVYAPWPASSCNDI